MFADELGSSVVAECLFKSALKVRPLNLRARRRLSLFYLRLSRLGEGITHTQIGIAQAPLDSRFWALLGVLHREGGRGEDAVRYLQHACGLDPENHKNAQQLVFQEFYRSELPPNRVRESHERWAASFAAPFYRENSPTPTRLKTNRRLRIGYVSPDWRFHAVEKFSECFLHHHDRSQFEVFCSSCLANGDVHTRTLSRLPEHWIESADFTDGELAERIRGDEIDILIDLAGHTPGSRALVFARQPAPVQISFIGYSGTTGISTINYRITDAFADPPEISEAHWTEKLVRLPETAWCFTPPVDPPPVEPAPSMKACRITFGILNNLAKFSPSPLRVRSKVLLAVPESRLLLVRDTLQDPVVRDRLLQHFSNNGISPDRLEFRGWPKNAGNRLAAYHLIDIALDTFPFNGMTTTCDALYMGVPVVALAGTIHVGRMGVSVLHNVGLEDSCLAHSETEYVEKAARLAADCSALATIRRELRPQMVRSPLMNGPRYTRHLENAFTQLANQSESD